MSQDPIEIFTTAYNYAIDFVNNLSKNYPDFPYFVDVLYVSSIILESISKYGIDNLKEPDFNDTLSVILEDRIKRNKDYLRDSFADIISSLSDDLIDYFSGLDDIEQMNIISEAINDTILNEENLYDNSGLNKIIEKIEPYVEDLIYNTQIDELEEKRNLQ
jgi:hypothetical protein